MVAFIQNMSIWQLLIILVIVVAIFGTKKLRNMGSDVGGAVNEFKKALKDDSASETDEKIVSEQKEEI